MSVEIYKEFRKRKEPPKWGAPKIDHTVLQGLMHPMARRSRPRP